MKKIISTLSLAFCFAIVHTQTLEQIVQKYTDSMGGKEKLLALKTVKMHGNMTAQGGVDVDMTFSKTHNVGLRADINVMGTENYQIITPEKGIMFMPIQGMTSPTEMTADQLVPAQNQLDIQGALLNYAVKGTSVDLKGKETIDGIPCQHLTLTFKNKTLMQYYLSEASGRLYKSISKRNINGTDTDVESTYSNYKITAEGYWFPMTIVSIQGETSYDKVEVNIAIDNGIYKN